MALFDLQADPNYQLDLQEQDRLQADPNHQLDLQEQDHLRFFKGLVLGVSLSTVIWIFIWHVFF